MDREKGFGENPKLLLFSPSVLTQMLALVYLQIEMELIINTGLPDGVLLVITELSALLVNPDGYNIAIMFATNVILSNLLF